MVPRNCSKNGVVARFLIFSKEVKLNGVKAVDKKIILIVKLYGVIENLWCKDEVLELNNYKILRGHLNVKL